jgi:hypothetical protein
MSMRKICPLCRESFPRNSPIKVTSVEFDSDLEHLKSECPLNPQSPTKKHREATETGVVGKKLPE